MSLESIDPQENNEEEEIIPPREKDFDISQLGEPDSEGIRKLIEEMQKEENE